MELIGKYVVPQRTREKAFHTWTQTQQTQWCERVFFSGLGFWERTFLGWGFNFMYSEEKNTKILSIKKFIHKRDTRHRLRNGRLYVEYGGVGLKWWFCFMWDCGAGSGCNGKRK